VGADTPYPRQNDLPVHPEDPDDHSVRLGLVPYHDIAPALNELMDDSDRVSAEIIGTSTRGRDLYLVTLTEPENRGRADQQRRMRELIADDPARAARDRTLPDRYKTPVLVNANIHGNEWEGTDASLRVIEELALSEEPATEELLDGARLYFVLTANPDGRVAGTRANGNGFDVQPGTSVRAFIEQRGLDPQYVVVERNGEPVERARYDKVLLADGDRLELVRAVAGG
jgi:thiamine biosynthesis protein ThiS